MPHIYKTLLYGEALNSLMASPQMHVSSAQTLVPLIQQDSTHKLGLAGFQSQQRDTYSITYTIYGLY